MWTLWFCGFAPYLVCNKLACMYSFSIFFTFGKMILFKYKVLRGHNNDAKEKKKIEFKMK